MKVPLRAIWLMIALSLCSCAVHPCGKVLHEARRADFDFVNFKGQNHVYPVAVTKGSGAPMLMTHGLGGLDGTTLEWALELSHHGWKVYLPMLEGEFNGCDFIAHKRAMDASH